MADYQVTAPDGTVYQVTAPDNASQSDVFDMVQRQHTTVAPASVQQPPIQNPANLADSGLAFSAMDEALGKQLSGTTPNSFTQDYNAKLDQLRQQAIAAQPQEYTGMVIPLRRDAQGNKTLAVPGIVSGLANQAVSAVTAPYDIWNQNLRTQAVNPDTGQIVPNPEAISRSLDFATMFGPQSAALRAGEVIPGEVTSTLGAPTASQLKSAASAGYEAARANPTMVPGDAIANMAQTLKQTLQTEKGAIAKTAPDTFAVLDELSNPPTSGFGTYTGLEAARRGLSDIALKGGTDGVAAQTAIRQLDPIINQLAPEAADARANYAAAMRSNVLTGELDRANTGILEKAENRAAASNSGMNLDNTIRQRVASLLEKPREVYGFSDPELEAMNNLVQGTATQNAARRVGNFLGGGGGLGQLASLGVGAWLGGQFIPGGFGHEIGAALGPAIGTSAKALENRLALGHLNALDELIRQRSPLYQTLQAQGLPTVPSVGVNNLGMRVGLPSLADIIAGTNQ